jgi:hypothetical protein
LAKNDFLGALPFFQAKNLFFGNNFFWVHFVTKVSLHFWNQRKNTDILIPILAYFERKKCLTLYSESLTFLAPKKPFSQETAQNKEKRILKFDLRILSAFQIYMKYCKVPKSLDPTVYSDPNSYHRVKIVYWNFNLLIVTRKPKILENY